ncbi:eukaryotic-like serine/threonine-protein kinase [Candidatus Magnetomoraceae bacterium gMMP-13]
MKILSKIPLYWIGILISLFFIGLSFLELPFMESLELRYYDFSMRMDLSPYQNNSIKELAVITVDNKSINKLGPWPWPRSHFARLIDILSESQAGVIGLNFLFSEKEKNSTLIEIQNIKRMFQNILQESSELRALLKHLEETEIRVDNDTRLINSVKSAKNVIFPIHLKELSRFFISEEKEAIINKLLEFYDIPIVSSSNTPFSPLKTGSFVLPLFELSQASNGLGFVSPFYDMDGRIRQHILAVKYKDRFFPSYPLKLVIDFLNLTRDQINIVEGRGIQLKDRFIPTDESLKMLIRFTPYHPTIYSFYDVFSKSIDPSVFKNKIVIIDKLAKDNNIVSPFISYTNVIKNILNANSIIRPVWAFEAEISIMLFFCLYLVIIMPRLGGGLGLLSSIVLFILLTISSIVLLNIYGLWVKYIYAAFQLGIGSMFISFKCIFIPEKKKLKKDFEQLKIIETSQKLGRYEIIDEIGRGVMGVVYRARDTTDNHILAIKTLCFRESFDKKEVKALKKQFYKQVHESEKLSHPNIITIFDVSVDHGLYYIAMELLKGNDLKSVYNKNIPLSLKQVLNYVSQVCDALDYAHKKRVVHRNLKPSNIIILKNGKIKITDFGISELSSSYKINIGMAPGSPDYISPEQAEGFDEIDGRSDIFSLGVIFFELLTGRLPFKGNTNEALIYHISHTPHPSVGKFNPRLPVACEQIINKALEKDVNKRYQTAYAFKNHLDFLSKKIDHAMTVKQKKRG